MCPAQSEGALTCVWLQVMILLISAQKQKVVANWVSNNLLGLLKKSFITIDRSPISEQQMGDLIDLVTNGSLSGLPNCTSNMMHRTECLPAFSGTAGQAVLEELIQLKDGLSVQEVVQRMGLSQVEHWYFHWSASSFVNCTSSRSHQKRPFVQPVRKW